MIMSINVLNCILRQRKSSQLISLSLLPYYSNTKSIVKRYTSQKSTCEVTKINNNTSDNKIQTSFADVVKENTKSAWYVSVIIGGVGVTALILYGIFRELFSDKSPNSVYSKALDRCIKEPKIIDALGIPIKGYGEETRRGRRRHVNHKIYQHNDKLHMRMQFYIEGIRKRGTVHLEVCEDESGNFVYRYLFIQLDDLLNSVIIVEDNRANDMDSYKIDDVTPI